MGCCYIRAVIKLPMCLLHTGFHDFVEGSSFPFLLQGGRYSTTSPLLQFKVFSLPIHAALMNSAYFFMFSSDLSMVESN